MAASKSDRTPVNKEVREFLVNNGKKGGLVTKRLIELGKDAAKEYGVDIKEEVENEMQKRREIRSVPPQP